MGHALRLSPLMVGVVIVALGTSLPELISAILAATKGSTEIVTGNILGANVSNMFLILGLITIISTRSIFLGEEYIFIDLHFMLGSAMLLAYFMWDGSLSLIEGILLLAGFAIYQLHLFTSEKPGEMPVLTDQAEIEEVRSKHGPKDYVILVLSAVGIYFGAEYTIESIVDIAHQFSISEELISVTALSLGTTFPELFVSISAVRSGHAEIAIGNILGSCIFNALAVAGIASIINPVVVPPLMQEIGLVFLLIAAFFFYLLAQDKKISKWEGMLLLLFYVAFFLRICGFM